MSIALAQLVEDLKKQIQRLERQQDEDRKRIEALEESKTLRLPEKRRA